MKRQRTGYQTYSVMKIQRLHPADPLLGPGPEYASDDIDVYNDFVSFDEIPEEKSEPKEPGPGFHGGPKSDKRNKIMLKVIKEDPQKNPVALINELHKDAKWTLIAEQVTKFTTSFVMQLEVNSVKFTGEGRTKKTAKMAAAQEALMQLYNITSPDCGSDLPKSVIIKTEELHLLDQALANQIANAVASKAKTLFDSNSDLKKWTVLASIVLTDVKRPNWVDVVCITSGTKCVKGDNLSMMGCVVGDCHAEILARRCLLVYLYQQIYEYEQDSGANSTDTKDLIIVMREDSQGFRIKEGIRIHLYISTAPCGDARVFSPKEEALVDNHPNRLSRGVLRAKIENGEGTIPVKRESSTLTWDGILQGNQRLQFMSCSDKVCLWNVVGLQGALLSHFLEPVYLDSLILGNLFSYDHLFRAIYGRLNLNFESDSLKKLPEHYRINVSKVARAIVQESDTYRQTTKAPNYALNWMKNDFTPEVICTDTGKVRETTQPSRISKRSLFLHFSDLLKKGTPPLPTSCLKTNIPTIYRDGKTSSSNYQDAKTRAIKAFTEQNLGSWIQVPVEIDLFNL